MSATIYKFELPEKPSVDAGFKELHRHRLMYEMSRLVRFMVHLSDGMVNEMSVYCEKNQFFEGVEDLMYLQGVREIFLYRIKVVLDKLNELDGE